MNVLEGLYAARASISPEQFEFKNWTHCTCGHIYRGATGQFAAGMTTVLEPVGLHEAMLEAVVRAASLEVDRDHAYGVSFAVSSATTDVACERAGRARGSYEPTEDERREAAVLLITNAIEKLEAEQMAAMLEVKAASPSVQEPREPVGA